MQKIHKTSNRNAFGGYLIIFIINYEITVSSRIPMRIGVKDLVVFDIP